MTIWLIISYHSISCLLRLSEEARMELQRDPKRSHVQRPIIPALKKACLEMEQKGLLDLSNEVEVSLLLAACIDLLDANTPCHGELYNA